MAESQPRRKSKQLSSEDVPEDVVYNILTRLPVKSIIRFRCVSKSLNSIITNHDFINTHWDQAKLSSNNKGYLLYMERSENYYTLRKDLCTVVCNSGKTLSHVSRFQIPFSHLNIVGFCNGIFCVYDYADHIVYLWNPSIRKFKMLDTTRFCFPFTSGTDTLGFAYHSQNNDFKILRILCFQGSKAEAEVYTLSSDLCRRVVISLESEPNIGSIVGIVKSPFLFFNGALHSIAYSRDRKFILSFDVNDEIFRLIMLPQNYLDRVYVCSEHLAVFRGSLALIVLGKSPKLNCDIWVMREYGMVESWTKKSVPIDRDEKFLCCIDSGELLIDTFHSGLLSKDPESLNKNKLDIPQCRLWLGYTTDLMESLFLLDQVKCTLNMKISLYRKISC